ncbi:hypothetical protein FCH28_37155 [Streptomyces piniterrae]|uniref:Uncharacterized protein n=1 Tax=Streptomyces piniterrae TaxID=2571125 RepID=A0A4U0MLF4_9ACTN|nr:hypothetical protein [Streptomyces piniterrae]TJZ41461.1 hypothetical protein FCH28_37155 [Streptomyces piniterrae]
MTTTRSKTPQLTAAKAVEELRTALAGADIRLPSLTCDAASPDLNLVDLGRVSAQVAVALADVVRRGTR